MDTIRLKIIFVVIISLTLLINGVGSSSINTDRYLEINNYGSSSALNDNIKGKNTITEEYETLQDYVQGGIIVKFKSDSELKIRSTKNGIIKTGISSVDNLNAQYKVTNIQKVFPKYTTVNDIYGLSDFYTLNFPINSDIHSIIEQYKKDPNVESAGLNPIMNAYLNPDDPYYLSNGSWGQDHLDIYGLHLINASGAWDITTGRNDIIVAVIDTGIDYNHEDLAENMWINEDEILDGTDTDGDGFIDNLYGADIYNNDSDPMDDHGHGTHCAGTIAAVGNNTLGVVGVSWQTKIMAVKVLSSGGSSDAARLAAGIVWAADQGADVLSNSWGSDRPYPSEPTIEAAIRYAYDKGCVIVFAAGNEQDDVKYYCPQNMEETITVAATDLNDNKAEFSNSGNLVDVSAPGVDILSLRANNTDLYGNGIHVVDENYYYASGTSMACPHVAGLAALLLSKNHSLSQDAVRTLIKYTVDEAYSHPNEYIGTGRINASKAVHRTPAAIRLKSSTNPTNIKGLVEINGSAWGQNLEYYKLEYGQGQEPIQWIEIINSTISVQNNILGILDSTTLGEGFYKIRLQVVCIDAIYEEETWMIVNNEYNIFNVSSDPSDDYITIQDAIDNAGYKDTIYVRNGTYYERITIDKSINLVGGDRYTTIIDGYGSSNVINIYGKGGASISGFTIENSSQYSSGIMIYFDVSNTDNNNITNNIIKNNGKGIVLQRSSYNNISGNDIIENSNNGIILGSSIGGSNYNTVSNNTFVNNGQKGILFYTFSQNNIISKNIIDNHNYGVFLNEYFLTGINNNNTFFENIISNNTWGIYFSTSYSSFSSDFNSIFHNNFINNTYHARDIYDNQWDNDYPSSGNYWDDYSGGDQYHGINQDIPGSDGLGDVSYTIIGGSGQDNYPVISPNGWLNAPPDIASKPSGQRFGTTGREYAYTTTTTDPEGYQMYYNFSWGDGTYSSWLGPYDSGDSVQASHIWGNDGAYAVKIKAMDVRGVENDWSASLIVRIFGVQMHKVEGPVSMPPIPPG